MSSNNARPNSNSPEPGVEGIWPVILGVVIVVGFLVVRGWGG